MPEPDKIAGVVQEWITKAENDRKNATHTLKLGRVRREVRGLLEGEALF